MALTNEEATIVLGMVARGDNRHDIAAWFGVNQGRIAEVEQGSHGNLAAAPANQLPPKGPPGPKGRRLVASVERALDALHANDAATAKNVLKEAAVCYYQNEP